MKIRLRTVKLTPDQELWINFNDLLIALHEISESNNVSYSVKPGVRYVKHLLKKTVYDIDV